MLKSFFITAIRNLKKNRLYSAINILGLSLGVACCMVIFVVVNFESSFDNYHKKASRIYRVNLFQQTPEGTRFDGCNYSPLAHTIRNEVTGLEQVTGVYCLQRYQFAVEKNLFEGQYAFFADQNYFDVFDVNWIAGDKARALAVPNSVVVTDAFAEKFLGGISKALGRTLVLESKLPLTVNGIVKTPPLNTDHPYSVLISYPSLARFIPESVNNWQTVGAGATYVVFSENTQPDQINYQFNKIIQKQLKADLAKNTQFHLLPLKDNHDRNYDYTSFTYDFPVPLMIILSIMAGLIAFIACINFVNLATAQSLKRGREVGIRKTMGSSRLQLMIQYMSEAFIITVLAVSIGLFFAQIGLLHLNEIYGGNYLRFNVWDEPSTIVFIGGISVAISLLAGFYPAFILSGYNPVLALKSQTFTGKSKGLLFRRGLVIAQFTGAQLLIIVTMILINQVNSFKNRPLSFDPKTIVLLPSLRDNENQQHDKLRHELQKNPGILTYSFGNVGNETGEFYTHKQLKHSGLISYADTAYIHTFQMELLAGKNLSPDFGRDQVLVNETLIQTLGIKNPVVAIGSTYLLNDQRVVIRGVIKDSFTQPLSNKVDPITLVYDPEKFSSVAMAIAPKQASETLRGIEKAWNTVYPDYLCRYQFMDESLNRAYGSFTIIFSILGSASFLAIFIGCLGLYGLVSFLALQRTKEIGIRKVFGARVVGIMVLFSKESTILMLIAFVLATPLAHFLGIALLMEFPERVNPGVGIFLLSFLVTLLIALLTIGYRSYQAAVQNPVESLRADS